MKWGAKLGHTVGIHQQGYPVHPGRRHHDGVHLTLPQPRGHGVEIGGTRPTPLHRLCIAIPGHRHPMGYCPHSNPHGMEIALRSLRLARLTRATLPLLATPQGANHTHASTREPTRTACVTTDVVASPMTMRANGHQAPRFARPLPPRCIGREDTPKGVARHVTSRCPRPPLDACNQFDAFPKASA